MTINLAMSVVSGLMSPKLVGNLRMTTSVVLGIPSKTTGTGIRARQDNQRASALRDRQAHQSPLRSWVDAEVVPIEPPLIIFFGGKDFFAIVGGRGDVELIFQAVGQPRIFIGLCGLEVQLLEPGDEFDLQQMRYAA